jgi:hypothetical protein
MKDRRFGVTRFFLPKVKSRTDVLKKRRSFTLTQPYPPNQGWPTWPTGGPHNTYWITRGPHCYIHISRGERGVLKAVIYQQISFNETIQVTEGHMLTRPVPIHTASHPTRYPNWFIERRDNVVDAFHHSWWLNSLTVVISSDTCWTTVNPNDPRHKTVFLATLLNTAPERKRQMDCRRQCRGISKQPNVKKSLAFLQSYISSEP